VGRKRPRAVRVDRRQTTKCGCSADSVVGNNLFSLFKENTPVARILLFTEVHRNWEKEDVILEVFHLLIRQRNKSE